MAKYARTNELETYWSHYHCADRDCPGKDRKHAPPYENKSGWTDLTIGRKRSRFVAEQTIDNR